MKKILFYAASLVAVATACNKINSEPVGDVSEPASGVKMIIETVTARQGTSTKATISDTDASFAWTAGDNIAVHVSNGKYVYTSDEGASGASEAAAKASFTVAYPEGTSRDAFAVYPSTIVAKDAANYGQEGHTLDVTLPDSYTLAQVSGVTSQGPMIATNTPGDGWDFYQLCGMLRLTINSIPATAKRLEIDFNGKKVCGNFSIAAPVTPNTSNIATDDDATKDCITITKDGTDAVLGITNLVANIPLPVGEYASITITAYDAISEGSAILTITRPFAYTASNEKGVKRTASYPSSTTAFRGYEVSTGILKRDASTTPATYSLTSGEMVLTADADGKNEHYALPDGCNPFEPAVYYGNDDNRDKYFNMWLTLRSELGATGNNINATSDKLPAGWRFPSAGGSLHSTGTDWGNILFGTPKSTITVNGNTVSSNAYAVVTVKLGAENPYSVAAGNYYGMLLLRDGATILAEHLTHLGTGHTYADNELTQAEFGELVKLGCLFISASGLYHNERGWEELGSSYWKSGFYWSNIYSSENKYLMFKFDQNGAYVSASSSSNSSQREYKVVKLVKPL